MMKNWKRIAAGLLAALMITGCGSVDETISTVNAVVGVVDELTADATTENDTADGSEDDAAAEETATTETATGDGASADAAAEEAVASRPEENLDDFDPAFSVEADTEEIDEDGYYYDKDNVALYLMTYHKLPSNYITKKEAQALGWSGGALEPYAPDMAIGGDRFGNYEGVLPDDVDYHECDIDTQGTKRGAKRIVYSEDWEIYYTEDHYETFEQLY